MTEMPGFLNTACVVYNIATTVRNAQIDAKRRRQASALRVIARFQQIFEELARLEALVEAQEQDGGLVQDRRLISLMRASRRLRKTR